MKSTINLALKEQAGKKKLDFSLFPLVIFGIVFLIASSLLAIKQFLRISLDNLTTQESTLRNNINKLSAKKVKYLIVKERTGNIISVINKRDPLNKQISDIISVLPDSLEVVQIDAKEKKVSVKLASLDLFLMNQVLETVIPNFATDPKNKVKKVDIGSFGVDKNSGFYLLTLNFDYVK